MRNSSKISYFVIGSATLALLAGCSGGGSGIASTPAAGGGVTEQSTARALPVSQIASTSVVRPGIVMHPRTPGAVRPFVNSAALAKTPITLVMSDVNNQVVDVLDSSGNLEATLSDNFNYPQGLATDIEGDLFIADTQNSRIVKYAAGFQGAPTSISDPNQYPADVDSFSNGKWLAVTNIISTSDGPGSVTIYKDDKIVSTVSSAFLKKPFFCAFDATGNLYVSGKDAKGNATVGEIPNATSGGKLAYTELTTTNSLVFPGGIQVTTAGSIVIDDQGTATLYTYSPPKNGSLGSPTATTPLGGSEDVVTFAFTKDMSVLWGADYGLDGAGRWNYPAGQIGGTPTGFFIPYFGVPVGAAIIPTQFPKVQT